jgi:hypothetical protein
MGVSLWNACTNYSHTEGVTTMITPTATRDGRIIHVLAQTDLDDPLPSEERVRAFCPIHGGDTQRSLSIDATSGWGYCHCCHATVLVEEYAPTIAEHLRHGGRGVSRTGSPSADVAHPRSSHSRPQARPAPVTPAVSRWQRDEREALQLVWALCQREACSSSRACAYLSERNAPLEIAQASGVGYLTRRTWEAAPIPDEQRTLLKRWIGRVIFPLGSPDGQGYIGRSLWYWEPGMNENQHKALLEVRGVKRWIKTNPAGWFGFDAPSALATAVALVEGGFDRLSLMAAGLPSNAVMALVGTAARPQWLLQLAPQVSGIVLALDADAGGIAAMERLADELRRVGLAVALCPPPKDAWGKDWSERFRRIGQQCVWPLYEALTVVSAKQQR